MSRIPTDLEFKALEALYHHEGLHKQRIASLAGINPDTIFKMAKSLVDRKWIEQYDIEYPRMGGLPRPIYRLTQKGKNFVHFILSSETPKSVRNNGRV